MTTDGSSNNSFGTMEATGEHLFDRQEFMKLSAYAVMAAAATKVGLVPSHAQAQSVFARVDRIRQ